MTKFLQRIKEPSTWAGLAVIAGLFGLDPQKVAAVGHLAQAVVPFVPVDGGMLAQAVTAAAAGIAVLLPESKQGGQG
jgi:hypothetical protein